MYRYTFQLSPARQKSELIFTQHQTILQEALDAINSGISFQRDGKHLDMLHIKDKELILCLTSQEALPNPARSLSALTRYLTTNYPAIFSPYIYNKTLCNMYLLSQEETSVPQADFTLSNEEILKEMVDLLYTYPNTKEVKSAKNEIISILQPFVAKK